MALTDGRAWRCRPRRTTSGLRRRQGTNTGGMGAYSPAPVVTPALDEEIMRTVVEPTVRAMAAEGRPTAACSTPA